MLAYHSESKVSLSILDGIVNQLGILLHAGSLVDQGRIRGGILGLEAINGFDVSSIANDDGVFFELIELRSHGDSVR
jgi:hypothetical protein